MNKIKINTIIFFLILCCIKVNVFAATGPGVTMASQETTKGSWGVKIVPAEYYDYVEHDDQGRLVDKNRIIIGKDETDLGQSGGSSVQGGDVIVDTANNTNSYSEAGIYKAVGDRIWIRDQANNNSKRLAGVDKGDLVRVIRFYDKNWAIINYDGKEAFVSRQYIERIDNMSDDQINVEQKNEYEKKISNNDKTENKNYDGEISKINKKKIIIDAESKISIEGVGGDIVTDDQKKEKELLESIADRLSKTETTKNNIGDDKKNNNLSEFIKNFFSKLSNNKKTLKLILPEPPYYVKKDFETSIEIEGWEYEAIREGDRFKVVIKCLVKKISRYNNASFKIKLKNDVDFVVLSWESWNNAFDNISVGEVVERTITFYDVPYSDSYILIIE